MAEVHRERELLCRTISFARKQLVNKRMSPGSTVNANDANKQVSSATLQCKTNAQTTSCKRASSFQVEPGGKCSWIYYDFLSKDKRLREQRDYVQVTTLSSVPLRIITATLKTAPFKTTLI